MATLLLAFLFLLNFAISWWNAYVCGKTWAETKSAGGWRRFVTWIAAMMSAIGFTWCYMLVLAFGAYYFQFINEAGLDLTLKIGFLVLMPAAVFASWMITIDSWAQAYRNGGVLNYGVAAYNTYASVHNTMSLISNFGDAFGSIFSALGSGGGSKSSSSSSSSSDDNGSAMLVIVGAIIVAVAVSLGVITTVCIIRKVSASDRLPSLEELRERRRLEGKPDVA